MIISNTGKVSKKFSDCRNGRNDLWMAPSIRIGSADFCRWSRAKLGRWKPAFAIFQPYSTRNTTYKCKIHLNGRCEVEISRLIVVSGPGGQSPVQFVAPHLAALFKAYVRRTEMRDLFKKFRKEESGATLVEYGVALILAVIVGGAALTTLAGDVSAQMGEAETLLETY